MESPRTGPLHGQTWICDRGNSGSGDRSHPQRDWWEVTQEALGEETETEWGDVLPHSWFQSHSGEGLQSSEDCALASHLYWLWVPENSACWECEGTEKHNFPGPQGSMWLVSPWVAGRRASSLAPLPGTWPRPFLLLYLGEVLPTKAVNLETSQVWFGKIGTLSSGN